MTEKLRTDLHQKVADNGFMLMEYKEISRWLAVVIAVRQRPKGFHDYVCWNFNFSTDPTILGFGKYCDTEEQAKREMRERIK